jgi:hypothetical protein
MSPLQHKRLVAERDFHLAAAAALDEQIRADPVVQIDLTKFDPIWKSKSGRNLSPLGVTAILAAFDSRMKQTDIANLFHISESAANHWSQRWFERRQNEPKVAIPSAEK